MCIEGLKEELALAIDKWFKFTISYYNISLEICKEAIATQAVWVTISYLNNFIYPNAFKNQKVHRGLDTQGSVVYFYITYFLMYG